MAGQGRWSLQAKYKRCTGERKCSACAANPDRAPHGPYYELRRRHPETSVQQFVYLGINGLTDQELKIVNDFFRGEVPPTPSEVRLVIENTPQK